MQRVPQLLLPHLESKTEQQLSLLTGTLAACPSWLVLRLIALHLDSLASNRDEPNNGPTVLLVTWLRSTQFWLEGFKKLGILPHKVKVIDALAEPKMMTKSMPIELKPRVQSLRDQSGGKNPVLLVLDGLDSLLARSACTVRESLDLIQELQMSVKHLVITTQADAPLIHHSTQSTPLEANHAEWILTLAHQASQILAVRSLDSGVAKDVTGVLSILDRQDDLNTTAEYLYHVTADGSARVFERGS